MRYALILAAAAVAIPYSTASAQTADTYADAVAKVELEKARKVFSEYKDIVKGMYFGAKCQVVSEAEAANATAIIATKFYYRFNPEKVRQKLDEAKQEGISAANTRGCGFWKENAEATSELRNGVREEINAAIANAYARRALRSYDSGYYNSLYSSHRGF